MSILKVERLSQRFGDKVLYEEANFELNQREHLVLVGPNGIGKSTLINILVGEADPDGGKIEWDDKIKVGYLDQYAKLDTNLSLLEYLRGVFVELYDLKDKLDQNLAVLEKNYDAKLLQKVLHQQQVLAEADFEELDLKLRRIAAGLGLTAVGLDKKIGEISGGQRAKLILAKLLLENPEVILLDEPTNFLDKEHVAWLASYLQKFAGALLLISHDMSFVNQIATHILVIENGQLRKYRGNYDDYVQQKELQNLTQSNAYQKQQKLIAKTEDYIARNGVRTATARQAQSRQKMLDKMVRLAPPTENQKSLRLSFATATGPAGTILQVNNLVVGYEKALLPALNFRLRAGEKIVITGFNGIGKSTLLKTLLGEIPALAGVSKFTIGTKVNYFAQDLKWQDLLMTPLQIVWSAFPSLEQSAIRAKLAQAGVKKDLVNSRIVSLSGGEQAKVKLTLMMLRQSNFLILDEPTNHLDVLAKKALQKALIDFTGTLILVSHEKSFYQDWASRILAVDDQKNEVFLDQ
ncbi:MAG: ABC-F family ATP-binding cassette domain-containing protein [bacterium]|nr:ABC-F family ATP-binding cassette domain-containing protein [bacterium]